MLHRYRNSAWAVAEYAWYPLLGFLFTPLFLRTLGREQYGLWMMLVATVSIGQVLNTGTGAATIKLVSSQIGRDDTGGLHRAIRGSLAVGILGGSAIGILMICLFWFGDASIFGKMGDHHLLHATGLAAACLALLEQVDNVFSSTLRGMEKFGAAARTEIAAKTIQVLLLAGALLSGATLWIVYLILITTSVLRLAMKAWVTRGAVKGLVLWPKLADAAEILHFSKWAWLQGVGGMIFNSADKLLVGSLLGAASLAQYSVVTQLAVQIHGVTSAGIGVVFPMISRQRALDPSFSIARMTSRIFLANAAVSTLIAAAIFIFGSPILHVWLGKADSEGTDLLLKYVSVAYWLLALNITPFYVLLGLGKARVVAIWVFIGGSIGLLPLTLVIEKYGLVGAGVGKLIFAFATLMLFIPLIQAILADADTREASKLASQ